MVSSLLKIAFISILSCISPLKEGVSSSHSNINKNFLSREAASSFSSSIVDVSSDNVFVDYTDDGYIDLFNDDLISGNFDNFTYSAFSSSYHITFGIYDNSTDSWNNFTTQLVAFTDQKVLKLYSSATTTYSLDFTNRVIYSSTMSSTENTYYDGIRLYLYGERDSSYQNDYTRFYLALESYINSHAYNTYSISLSKIVSYKYVNLADFFIEYTDALDSLFVFKWGINTAGNEYGISRITWSDEQNITLSLDGENKGLFTLNDSNVYLYESLTIRYVPSNYSALFLKL